MRDAGCGMRVKIEVGCGITKILMAGYGINLLLRDAGLRGELQLNQAGSG